MPSFAYVLTEENPQVARAFKKLIDGTPSLRYKLLLYATGMRDGPPGGSSVTQRLERLEEYEATWNTKDTIIQDRGQGSFSSGVFVTCDRQQYELNIRRPASLFSGIPEKTWTVDLSNLDDEGGPNFEHISSYVVDVAQDLLVLTVLPNPPDPEGDDDDDDEQSE